MHVFSCAGFARGGTRFRGGTGVCGGGRLRRRRRVPCKPPCFFVSLVLYVLRMTARTPLVRRGGCQSFGIFLRGFLRGGSAMFRGGAGVTVAAGCGGGGECRASRLVFCVAGVVCVANDGKDSAGETGRLTIFWYFLARGFCAGRRDVSRRRRCVKTAAIRGAAVCGGGAAFLHQFGLSRNAAP